MDFFDLPGYGEGGKVADTNARLTVHDADGNIVEERDIRVYKIGYSMPISHDQLVFEDMFSPHWQGPLTLEETEYSEYRRQVEEPPDDLDLYEEGWE